MVNIPHVHLVANIYSHAFSHSLPCPPPSLPQDAGHDGRRSLHTSSQTSESTDPSVHRGGAHGRLWMNGSTESTLRCVVFLGGGMVGRGMVCVVGASYVLSGWVLVGVEWLGEERAWRVTEVKTPQQRGLFSSMDDTHGRQPSQ